MTSPEQDQPGDHFAELITGWKNFVAIPSAESHYDAQRHFNRRHGIIGSAAAVSSALAAVAALKGVDHALPFIVLLSVVGAGLAAFQTFFRDSDRANRHRLTGAGYAAVRRDIDEALALPPQS